MLHTKEKQKRGIEFVACRRAERWSQAMRKSKVVFLFFLFFFFFPPDG